MKLSKAHGKLNIKKIIKEEQVGVSMILIETLLIILAVAALWVYWREELRQKKDRAPVARVQYFWDVEDRRRQERVNLVFKARYKVAKDPRRISRESLTDNISARGLKLIVYEKLQIGEVMELEIEIPPDEVLKCRGEVMWIKDLGLEECGKEEKEKRSFTVGLRFTYLPSVVAERLISFVDEDSPAFKAAAA